MAAAIAVLSTAALSLAGSSPPVTEPLPTIEAEVLIVDEPLVVPDVRGQPYVFAKTIIDDAGFAWRVKGKVEGFPANAVATQKPAPGTLVVDTGAPTMVLTLQRNKDYDERGLPKNTSPYKGTKIVLWEDPNALTQTAPAEPPPSEPAAPDETPKADASDRPPAFIVPGAPPEPLDEITLIARANTLGARLADASHTAELEQHWLYQHEWIVTGAEFGWFSGEEALVRLIAIDEDLQARWGIGAKSAAVARDALTIARQKTAEANQ